MTLGEITLPIQARPVTQLVLFIVVEDLGPYNCIVGQAWLHSMKVVPSTYHQMISYLSSTGQVDLLSSQLGARQCYQLSVQEQKEEKGSNSLPLGDHVPTYQLQFAAQVRVEEKDPLTLDPLEILALDKPEKFTYVNTLLSSEEK